MVEYEPEDARSRSGQLYIRNTISLKGLEPGDYDLTIILRDELDKGRSPDRQVVKFKVIPPTTPGRSPEARRRKRPRTRPRSR